jgi:hypothetical protein
VSRPLGVLAVIGAALALTPSAAAWSRVADLPYAVDLVGLRTHAGTELLAWEGGPAGFVPRDVLAMRLGTPPRVLASLADDEELTGLPVVLQQPGGTLLLYYSTTRGVFRLVSKDDGRDWSNPEATLFRRTERVLAGTVRPDGTPVLTVWDWSGDSSDEPLLEVVQGLDGDVRHPISIDALGSVAVTRANRAYLLYSFNPGEFVPGKPGTYVQRLDAEGAPAGTRRRLGASPAGPILADRFGDVLVPAARRNKLLLIDVGGKRWVTHVVASGAWRGWGAPLLPDPRGGISTLWRSDRAYLAARSRSRGVRFEHRTEPVEPPDLGLTTEGSPASTAAIPWAGGVDLFVAYSDRIVRERFRVR